MEIDVLFLSFQSVSFEKSIHKMVIAFSRFKNSLVIFRRSVTYEYN